MRKVQEEKGIKVKTLEDEPTLSPHLFWVWKAFTDLNTRRPVAGMGGYLPLSYSEIEAYCRLKGIMFHGERERLVYLLEVLDREWMKTYIEKEEKKNPSKKTPPPPSHSPPRGGGSRSPPRTQVT